MATVISGNQIKLDNGKTITANTGGWYDGQQFWGGTLSAPGVINSLSNQQGAGQTVNPEVIAASNITQGLKPGTNEAYLAKQTALYNTQSGGTTGGTAGASTASSATTVTTPEVSAIEKQISDLNASIATKKAEADKRRSEVNENPFLSEASRVGRIAKIDSLLNDTLQTDQATLNNLNTTLTAKKAEIKPDVQYDYKEVGDNVVLVALDKKTGKMTQTIVGKAKTSSTGGGGTITKTTINAFNTDAQTVDWSKEMDSEGNEVNISPYMKLVIKYAPKMTLDQIHDYYLQSSLGQKWGEPTEDSAMITALYNQARGL